ncbi:hypothetical protein BDK51DRAFT_36788 [Blyttiomyces helicus]|uniref:Uncharacterized protein n=1 Tax=Blyttiomyces helicus TaxID=388810 RepID=A0A4P9WK78_9FUNG|nr:hypothetical protein BDK51DRAFT_36788 [Blyttiomyces helicus]|eukprot:RKO91968.1 hypothetical protein BDK51DRAFT_36788 [Blyttiomyces helicus]
MPLRPPTTDPDIEDLGTERVLDDIFGTPAAPPPATATPTAPADPASSSVAKRKRGRPPKDHNSDAGSSGIIVSDDSDDDEDAQPRQDRTRRRVVPAKRPERPAREGGEEEDEEAWFDVTTHRQNAPVVDDDDDDDSDSDRKESRRADSDDEEVVKSEPADAILLDTDSEDDAEAESEEEIKPKREQSREPSRSPSLTPPPEMLPNSRMQGLQELRRGLDAMEPQLAADPYAHIARSLPTTANLDEETLRAIQPPPGDDGYLVILRIRCIDWDVDQRTEREVGPPLIMRFKSKKAFSKVYASVIQARFPTLQENEIKLEYKETIPMYSQGAPWMLQMPEAEEVPIGARRPSAGLAYFLRTPLLAFIKCALMLCTFPLQTRTPARTKTT